MLSCLGLQFWKQLTCPLSLRNSRLGPRQLITLCSLPSQQCLTSTEKQTNKQKELPQAQGQKGGCRRGHMKSGTDLQARYRRTHLKTSQNSFHKLGNYTDMETAYSFPYLAQNLFFPPILP